jgi:hypothetical protein
VRLSAEHLLADFPIRFLIAMTGLTLLRAAGQFIRRFGA